MKKSFNKYKSYFLNFILKIFRLANLMPTIVIVFLILILTLVANNTGLPVYFKKISNIQYDYLSSDQDIKSVKEFLASSFSRRNTIRKIEISFDFEIYSLDGWQNIFQTSERSKGIRLEISEEGVIGLIVGADNARGFAVGGLPLRIVPGKQYHVKILNDSDKCTININKDFSATLYNEEAKLNFKVDQIKVGSGYDKTRIFKGKIENFSFRYSEFYFSQVFRIFLLFIMVLFLFLRLFRRIKSIEYPLHDIKLRHLIAPFGLSLYPILFHYSHNLTQISQAFSVMDLRFPLVISFLFSVSILLSIFLFSGDIEKASILTCLSIVFFYSAGHIFNSLRNLIGPHTFLIIFVTIFCVMAIGIAKLNNFFAIILRFINIITIFVILFCLNTIFTNLQINKNDPAQEKYLIGEAINEEHSSLPDIYFIILDGYANEETLKNYLNYDNSWFLNGLRKQGFRVVKRSFSNYDRTSCSVPSIMGMQYIPKQKTFDSKWLYSIYQDSKVVGFLKERGYKFFYANPQHAIATQHRLADFSFVRPIYAGGNFLSTLMKNTVLFNFVKFDYYDEGRSLAMSSLDFVKDSVFYVDSPKLVFLHYFYTHHPYLFTRDGRDLEKKDKELLNSKEGYLETLEFTSKKILDLTNYILKNSKKEPIIILISDHGVYLNFLKNERYFSGDRRLLGSSVSPRNLAVFNLPSGGEVILYDNMSNVNIFRSIFNYYFNSNFEKLDDRAFILDDLNKEYLDVTEQVNYMWEKQF